MILDRPVLDDLAVLEIGERNNCPFIRLPFKGTIDSPKPALGWVYVPYELDDISIPKEGIRRLRLLQAEGVRASQVIIGHEIPIAEEQPTEPTQSKRISPFAVVGVISAVALGAVLIGALAAPAVVTTAVVAPVAIPSVSTLGAVGLLSGAVLLDPAVVIVCEGTEQWVQIYSWVEA
jgi:hypothetical protein